MGPEKRMPTPSTVPSGGGGLPTLTRSVHRAISPWAAAGEQRSVLATQGVATSSYPAGAVHCRRAALVGGAAGQT